MNSTISVFLSFFFFLAYIIRSNPLRLLVLGHAVIALSECFGLLPCYKLYLRCFKAKLCSVSLCQAEQLKESAVVQDDSDLEKKRREAEALLQSMGIGPDVHTGKSHSRLISSVRYTAPVAAVLCIRWSLGLRSLYRGYLAG